MTRGDCKLYNGTTFEPRISAVLLMALLGMPLSGNRIGFIIQGKPGQLKGLVVRVLAVRVLVVRVSAGREQDVLLRLV
jgi:hypothetical protein